MRGLDPRIHQKKRFLHQEDGIANDMLLPLTQFSEMAAPNRPAAEI
jgi:hypothetical protein